MNRSRRDRWPEYRPTRHVLIQRDPIYERPWQGFVVDWKKQGARWHALCVYMDESAPKSPVIWVWLPVDQLRPLYPDPNPPRDEWF